MGVRDGTAFPEPRESQAISPRRLASDLARAGAVGGRVMGEPYSVRIGPSDALGSAGGGMTGRMNPAAQKKNPTAQTVGHINRTT